MKKGFETIAKILADKYGAGAMHFDPTPILWAAEKISDTRQARRELSALNRHREKYGRLVAVPAFGSRLF